MTNTTTIIPSSREEFNRIANSANLSSHCFFSPYKYACDFISRSEMDGIMGANRNDHDAYNKLFSVLMQRGASLEVIITTLCICERFYRRSTNARNWVNCKFEEAAEAHSRNDNLLVIDDDSSNYNSSSDLKDVKVLYDLITQYNGDKKSLLKIMEAAKQIRHAVSCNKDRLLSMFSTEEIDALDGILLLVAAGNSLGFKMFIEAIDDIRNQCDETANDKPEEQESVVDSVIVIPTTDDELNEAIRRIEVAFNTVGGFVSHLKSSYSTQDLKDIRKGLEWISEQYLALVKAGYHDEISEEISDIAVFSSELLKLDKKYSSSKPKVFADTLIRLFRRFSIGDRKTVLKNIKEMINGKPKESTEKFEETPSAKKDVKKTESKKEDSNTKDYDPLPGADLYNRVVELCKHVDLLATTIAFKPADAYIVNAMLSTFVKSTNFNNKLKRKGYNGGKLVEVPMSKYQNKIPKSAKEWCTSIFEAPTDDANDPIVVFYQMKPEETEGGKHKSPRKLVIRSSKLEDYVTG